MGCAILLVLLILLIILLVYILLSLRRWWQKLKAAVSNRQVPLEPAAEWRQTEPTRPNEMLMTVKQCSEKNEEGMHALDLFELDDSFEQHSIRLKNVSVNLLQKQTIIRDNFVHSNFIDCLHILVGGTDKLLVTIVIRRTEFEESLDEAYRTINASIEKNMDNNAGNVIFIFDDLMNMSRYYGENITMSPLAASSAFDRVTQIQIPLMGQKIKFIPLESRENNVAIITKPDHYGFNDNLNHIKFRQNTSQHNTPVQILKHFKNAFIS